MIFTWKMKRCKTECGLDQTCNLHCGSYSQAHWLTDWLASWPTDLLAEWLTAQLANDWLTDWLTDLLTEWLTNWPTDLLNGWLTDWLADWLANLLTDWPDWLACSQLNADSTVWGLTEWYPDWKIYSWLFDCDLGLNR